jgi:sporulation protein YlmC with PRC-barrel domain
MTTVARSALYLLIVLAPAVWAAGAGKDKATWLDMRASELIGKHVANPEGKSLGKIEDLIVDMKGGHIPHVVLSFGGFADIGDKLFVFPVNAFTRDESRDRIVTKVERGQLAESKGFDRSNWPFQPPLQRASELRGKNVKDAAGKPVGEIEDVIVNLGSGKVRGVVLAQDGRKGPEPKQTLPLDSFSVAGDEVTLKRR